jgi:hypothetical protein
MESPRSCLAALSPASSEEWKFNSRSVVELQRQLLQLSMLRECVDQQLLRLCRMRALAELHAQRCQPRGQHASHRNREDSAITARQCRTAECVAIQLDGEIGEARQLAQQYEIAEVAIALSSHIVHGQCDVARYLMHSQHECAWPMDEPLLACVLAKRFFGATRSSALFHSPLLSRSSTM